MLRYFISRILQLVKYFWSRFKPFFWHSNNLKCNTFNIQCCNNTIGVHYKYRLNYIDLCVNISLIIFTYFTFVEAVGLGCHQREFSTALCRPSGLVGSPSRSPYPPLACQCTLSRELLCVVCHEEAPTLGARNIAHSCDASSVQRSEDVAVEFRWKV